MPKAKRGRNHIYSMRRNRSMRQKHLATLLGRSDRRVSHYESGDGLPTFEVAVLLEVALGVRLEDLYPDLYQQCHKLVLARALRLTDTAVRRSLLGRLLQKDTRHEHPGTG
jgi:ribosome-binding protein aMBF1 (putative translation factor)